MEYFIRNGILSEEMNKERLLGNQKVGEFHLMRERLLGNQKVGEIYQKSYY